MIALESIDLFSKMSQDELKALRGTTMERGFAAGQTIFKEGDLCDGIYVVKDGLVEISGTLSGNINRVLSKVEPGDFFGELAVIERLPRSATATAAKQTTVYFVPRDEVLRLIERCPGLALGLLLKISRRLREFTHLYLNEVVQAERFAVIGRFARSIVHDVKNPLAVIALTSEVMDVAPELHATGKTRILSQVNRITDLVGQVLEFTQESKPSISLAPASYRPFVHQVFEELRATLDIKSVLLELAGDVPPVEIQLDARQLRRVFYNLVHNAADAMPNGGTISLCFAQNVNEVVTEIRDHGYGIPPELEGRLFEPFATHGKSHGTGLGLAISKTIVEEHNGRIWARNAPEGGAVFSFALPVVQR